MSYNQVQCLLFRVGFSPSTTGKGGSLGVKGSTIGRSRRLLHGPAPTLSTSPLGTSPSTSPTRVRKSYLLCWIETWTSIWMQSLWMSWTLLYPRLPLPKLPAATPPYSALHSPTLTTKAKSRSLILQQRTPPTTMTSRQKKSPQGSPRIRQWQAQKRPPR